MKRRTVLGYLALAAASTAAPARAQTAPVHLRLGSTANDDVTPALYAIDRGLFRQAGLDVDLTQSSNGTAVAAALAGGSLDIGRSSILPLITAYSHGVPFTLVGPSANYTGTLAAGAVLVLKDSPYHSGRDLDGKIVGASAINDISTIGVKMWIDKTGGSSTSVQFIEASGQEVGVALDAGRVAAANIVNPFRQQLMATGRYRVLIDPLAPLGSHLLVAAWFATKDYAAKNPDVILKFGNALATASAFCNEHPDQTGPLLASFAKIDPGVVAAMTRDKYDLKLIPASIQPVIDAAAKYNVIPKAFDARDFISPYAPK